MSESQPPKQEAQIVVSGGERRSRSRHHFSPGHPEFHEGAPEWLISFADMVMLVMGFFVILYALNVAPKQASARAQTPEDGQQQSPTPDMIDFAIAVRKAFNNEVDLASTNPKDRPLIDRILARQAGAGEARDDGEEGHEREVRSVRPAPRFGTGTSVQFADHSTVLTPEEEALVVGLGRSLRGLQSVIEVRGHASAAEAFREPEKAMRLAFDRALTVADVLSREGVEWRRLRLTSEGDHDRVALFPRDPTADRRNARVEVLVLDQIAGEAVPSRPTRAIEETSVLPPIEDGATGGSPASENGNDDDGRLP